MTHGPASFKRRRYLDPKAGHNLARGANNYAPDGSVSGRTGYGGPVESPMVTLDPQDADGAGTLYAQSVQRPDLLFPNAVYPWMLIMGPQLKQAPSVHNIYNAVPPIMVSYLANPQVNMNKSNRLKSIFSHRINLPNTGIFSTGGQS